MTVEEMRKRVDELRDQQAKAIGEARELLDRAMAEKRELTAEEDTSWRALADTAAELKTTISRAATQLELETDLAAPRRQAPLPDVRSGGGGGGGEPVDAATALNLTPKDRQQYSLVRAFRAYGRGRWDDAPFELECHEALEGHHKRQAMGFFVPTEALLVEHNLIKRHAPEYNLKMRDDKSYPYVAISVDEEYPRVYFTRERHLSKRLYSCLINIIERVR